MPGMKRILVGEKVWPRLLAAGEMLLDPKVLFDLSLENFLGLPHRLTGQILAFGDHSHTHHVTMLRNVPEPTLLRNKGHCRCPGIDARIAFGALVISPYGHFVEHWIFDPPVVPHRGEGFFARTVQRKRRAIFHRLPVWLLGADTADATALLEQAGNGDSLEDGGSPGSRMLHEHLVELRAQHLPGLRDILIVTGRKIKGLAGFARLRDKLHAVLFDEGRLSHFFDQPQPLERIKSERQERFADVVAG